MSPMTIYVARYILRDSSGNLIAAAHRRVNARSLAEAKKTAKAHLPNGHELGPISEAGPQDKQPWIGANPYAEREQRHYVRGE